MCGQAKLAIFFRTLTFERLFSTTKRSVNNSRKTCGQSEWRTPVKRKKTRVHHWVGFVRMLALIG